VLAAFQDLTHRLAQAKLPFAALALGLFIFSLWVGAVRWRRLLLAMGCRVPVMRLLLVNLVGIFANNITLNSRVAGEGARLAALRATDGVTADRLAISTLYERLADVVGGVLVIAAAIPAAWSVGASLHVARSAVGVAVVVAAVAVVAFLARRRLAALPIADWWRTAAAKYAARPSTFAFTVLCSVTISVQDPLRLMAGAAAFGVKLSLSQAAMVSAASMFASGLPTIGGLGAVEGGVIAALVALGVNLPTAVAVTALERGISLVFSTAAGGFAVFWLGGSGLWRRLRGSDRHQSSADAPPYLVAEDAQDCSSTLDILPEATRGDGAGAFAAVDRGPHRTVVLVICGNGPDPITLRKIEALALGDGYDLHLVYWRDGVSLRTYPFRVALPESSVHAIDLPDPNGPPLRGFALLIRFHARVFALARQLQPDVVHAVNFDMLVGGWLLCVGRSQRTLVYDLLDTQESLRQWPARLLQRAIMRRVDRIYATSPEFVTGFLRPLKLIRPDVEPEVIPNAPWAATFAAIATRREGPFVVGYIGSFRCEPAIAWLCESVDELRRSGLDVEVLFAGTGEARPLVEELAARHSFVRHQGAYDYERDIRGLYERIDLAFAVYDVSWDKRTHLACRLSDAIAAGRPIVAAARTYMGETIDAQRLGYLVDFSDRSTLTVAIRDAIHRREHWADPSRIPESVRREHTFEHYVPRLLATYPIGRDRRDAHVTLERSRETVAGSAAAKVSSADRQQMEHVG
jgi:uncharacterized membrane protein YbhN (UPF0104 family)/glycosyltransferase involved in cell wall biosynthesis